MILFPAAYLQPHPYTLLCRLYLWSEVASQDGAFVVSTYPMPLDHRTARMLPVTLSPERMRQYFNAPTTYKCPNFYLVDDEIAQTTLVMIDEAFHRDLDRCAKVCLYMFERLRLWGSVRPQTGYVITEAQIATACGVGRKFVIKVLTELLSRNIIERKWRGSSFTGVGSCYVLRQTEGSENLI